MLLRKALLGSLLRGEVSQSLMNIAASQAE